MIEFLKDMFVFSLRGWFILLTLGVILYQVFIWRKEKAKRKDRELEGSVFKKNDR